MAIRYLLDTNILVYSIDARDTRKQKRALETLRRLGRDPGAAVPAQALAEFSTVLLRDLEPSPTFEEIQRLIESYDRTFPVVPLTSLIVLEAVRGVKEHQFSYYDAQIWAAARLNQISHVLSEDFSDGSTVEGITFVNPLAPGFDLDDL